MKIMCQSPFSLHKRPRKATWILSGGRRQGFWQFDPPAGEKLFVCGVCRQHMMIISGFPKWWFEKLTEESAAALIAMRLRNEE